MVCELYLNKASEKKEWIESSSNSLSVATPAINWITFQKWIMPQSTQAGATQDQNPVIEAVQKGWLEL